MALERVEAISLLVECSTPCSLKSHAQMKVVAPQVGGAWARVGTSCLASTGFVCDPGGFLDAGLPRWPLARPRPLPQLFGRLRLAGQRVV